MFSKLKDPCKDKGKRHPLESILALMVVGMMCGLRGYNPIAIWARTQPDLAKALGFTHKQTPAGSTIHNKVDSKDRTTLTIEISSRL